MVQLAKDAKPSSTPIVIAVLVVLVLLAAAYFVYTIVRDDLESPVTEGQSIDTAALEDDSLDLLQYEPASEPDVSAEQVGRDNPYAPF